MGNTFREQQNTPLTRQKTKTIGLESVLIGIALVLVGLTGILPATIQNAAFLFTAVIIALTGSAYLIYPIMLFYGSVLGIFMAMSVYRWFTLLFLAATILKNQNLHIRGKQFAVFFLFVIYCLIVVCPENFRRGMFTIVDMIGIILLINCYLKQKENLRKFFLVYVLCAFVAYFTGTLLEDLEYNTVIGGQYVEMVRNMATFEDPNYMGYFYTGAIFALVGLKLFKPKIRFVMVIALYAMLLTSLSVTAIVVNAVMWFAYLLITKSINTKTVFAIVLIAVLVFGLYQYGLENPDDPVVGRLAMRIEEKLLQVETGDVGDATSNRSDLTQKHLEFFIDQPIYRMFIGMNAASALRTDLNGYKMAAHNEYVDWLLNVGVLGAMVMLYYLFSTIWEPLKNYRENMEDRSSLCVVMVKLVFVCYAFSLTLYGDYRFMLFMLL